ncbi:LysR family transcriptional regulator [Agromyces endophyticus]|uniref:LysR family transcriptional regulator n=1 Tax=Agromyces sp. H17E-10 TaxID=2932244 RepID=UPI001FD04193|nr:LysR family transcriptional regulator [Agromyces sp. H17E-10]UOQ87642.1 LysR family transcriptional regulator [Agromyces sp. H17E-10]
MAAHDLEHLRTFLTVLRAGSVSEGARLVGISQATASAHVQALEQQLGATLFERSPSGVVATPRALALGRRIAAHLDALDDVLAPTIAGEAVTIELGGAAEYLGEVVAPGIARLADASSIRVRMRFGLAEPLLDELRAGGLDLVVSSVRPAQRGLSAAPLVDEEFVLVGAPTLVAAGRLDEAALDAVPVIGYGDELPIVRRYWRSVFGRRPDHLVVAAVMPDLRAIRAALVAGAGMSVLPSYLVRRELDAGELVVLHEPEFAPLNTLYVVTRAGELERRGPLRAVAAALHEIAAPR